MVSVKVLPPGQVKIGTVPQDTIREDISFAVRISPNPPYEGDYIVTPSSETQTLFCNGKSMENNVVINPIPNNYGLITYNGFELTVS